jgi:hypothetical protein
VRTRRPGFKLLRRAPPHVCPSTPLQAFDAAAALALLGYQPPPRAPAPAKRGRGGRGAGAEEEEEAADLLAVLQARSERALGYFTPRDTANAVFVMARAGKPGDVEKWWLRAWEEVRAPGGAPIAAAPRWCSCWVGRAAGARGAA